MALSRSDFAIFQLPKLRFSSVFSTASFSAFSVSVFCLLFINSSLSRDNASVFALCASSKSFSAFFRILLFSSKSFCSIVFSLILSFTISPVSLIAFIRSSIFSDLFPASSSLLSRQSRISTRRRSSYSISAVLADSAAILALSLAD